ncbi:DEAD/DEAH box helicase [Paracoccus sp. SCSIO 75233]|uniref:DEAD/DEAH box helicase n=1 Tax=Paracoccus sp. SCSIO 75233 TaxID=3017782 RepID=UPI0022F00D7A|nr:DEAD/DEAH box helicase [Paracoccus sp. SCSIO 75233]WBU54680.1 DEAD/DEAH box helicase [Paracoccus sp. SCSIO 75233]
MTKFSDLKLDPKVLKAIAEAGYETPTPIQEGAIPPALEGRDVLGIAQTGTGKTASFTLPMITRLSRGRARARMPRSLVLCPTRELAAQVAENFDIYAKHTRLTKALLIGGVSFVEQDKLIDRGVDVLIATPGRLLDHFERGKLLLTGVEVMVVDEADRMLDMGFIPDIERIFQLTPFTRQTLFFSATMAPEIERITNTFLHTPERIEVARQATTSETITQKLVEITPTRKDQTAKQKRELLRALIEAEGEKLKNAIIFCNRKTEVDIVAKSLKKHGYDAAPIHGDLDQSQRMRTLDGFRDGSLRFLIASDVAARGLDIPDVSHVFNFDLPSHAEDYVHRIGRTGRAGRQGTAYSIATPADEKYLSGIENLVKQALPRAETPEGFSLSEAAKSSPREGRESRNGSRSRSRSRRDDRGEDQRRSNGADAAQDRAQDDRQRDDSRQDRQERQDDRRDRNRDDRREDRRGGRRDDRRRGDHGPSVVGMGDHVPEFLKHSFADALAATEAAAEAASDADTPAPETQEEQPKPKRKRRSSKAKDAVAEQAPDQAAETPAAAPEAAPETPTEPATAEADAAEEKPKPKRRTSTRSRKKAEPVAEDAAPDAADVQAEEPAPAKPKRTRRTTKAKKDAEDGAKPAEATPDDAAPAEPSPTDAASEEKPKPKRRASTRSRKKPVTEDAAEASQAADPESKEG